MRKQRDGESGEVVGRIESSGADGVEVVVAEAEGLPGVPIRLRAGLPAKMLDGEIVGLGRHTDVGHRGLAFCLHDLDERRVYQTLGFSSTAQYTENRLDMSRRQTRDLVGVGAALDELRQVDEAFCKGMISWSKARLLARIAVPETEGAWLERALELNCRQLEREVAQGEKGKPPRTDGRGLPHVRMKIQIKVDVVVHELWEQARRRIWAELGEEVSDAEVLRLMAEQSLRRPKEEGSREVDPSLFRVIVDRCPECRQEALRTDDGPMALDEKSAEEVARDAPVQVVPEALGDGTSDLVMAQGIDAPATPKMRREVLARDGFRCRCCGGRIGLNSHHVIWRSQGGRTVPENMLSVCTPCHSLIHEGLLVVRGRAPHGVSFSDRDGRPLSSPLPRRATEDLVIETGGGARASAPEGADVVLRMGAMPNEADCSWWLRHRHLMDWNPQRSLMFLTAGSPREDRSMSEKIDRLRIPDHRPGRFDDIIGQQRVVRSLRDATQAALMRGGAVAHVLLSGPPGLGKTTLGYALAAEMGSRCTLTSGPVIEDPIALLGYLTSLQDQDVLFVDEIHAMPRAVAEFLYQAMEDGRITIPVQCKETLETRSLTLRLPAFTLVGATTDPDRMPAPLVARFGLREELLPYEEGEIVAVLDRAAARQGIDVAPEAFPVLARAAWGTPREALRLLARLGDRLVAHGRTCADRGEAEQLLADLGIDEHGLGPIPRRALAILRRGRHPVGRRRLASMLALSPRTFTETCEPPLLRSGLVQGTPRGLVASE